MRDVPLIRCALAALLAAACWLAAPPVHAQDEPALAARAYERFKPMLDRLVRQSFVQGFASSQASAFDGCEQARTQLRAELERDVMPVALELFFSPPMQEQVQTILVDVYDAEQLRVAADGGNPPTRPEQSALIAERFRALGVDFQQDLMQDSRVAAALAAAVGRSLERVRQCRAARGPG